MSAILSEFIYKDAIFSIPEKGVEFDIKRNILELSLYESLSVPYITGQILVSDTDKIFERLKINGTERLSLTIRNSNYDLEFKKNFILTRTERKVKVGEGADAYLFYMTEDIFVLDVLKTVSKAYQGTPAGIIESVVAGEFNRQFAFIGDNPAQTAFTYIAPYISPLAVIENIKTRATTDAGFPFFVYASLSDDIIRMKSLSSILEETPINKRPFVYSVAASSAPDSLSRAFAVQELEYKGMNDTMEMIMRGAIQNQYNVLNIATNQRNTQNNFNINRVLDIGRNSMYNKDFAIDSKRIDTYNPNVMYRLVNHTTSDELGYHDEENIEAHANKLKSHAIRQSMTKHMVNLTVPGPTTWSAEYSWLGHQIDLQMYGSEDEVIDPVNSGSYVVISCRHVFSNETYKHVMSATKLTRGQQVSIPIGPGGFPSL